MEITPPSRYREGLDGKYLICGRPPGSYRIGAASAEIVIGEGERKIFPLKIGG